MRGEKSKKKKIGLNNSLSNLSSTIDKLDTGYTFLNIAKWIFYIVPAAFLIYIYIMIINSNMAFETLITETPLVTVTFINAMVDLFCAWVIKNGIDELKSRKNKHAVKASLTLIGVGQILAGNIIASGFIFLGLFKLKEASKGNVFKIYISEIRKSSKAAILNLVGSIIILMIFALSFWFYIQIYSR
ncbi:MAG: hypothetical protein RR636_14560 [Clostridium sp.]|uniref:hypothetical protein n=1 Tax=Clostridium sp. TaxID=1506 RepID=UPI002FC5CBD7